MNSFFKNLALSFTLLSSGMALEEDMGSLSLTSSTSSSVQTNDKSKLEKLPTEIQAKIYGYLPLEDLATVSETSRELYANVYGTQKARLFYSLPFKELTSTEHLLNHPAPDLVKKINVGEYSAPAFVFFEIADIFPALESWDLNNLTLLTSDTFTRLIQKTPQLKELQSMSWPRTNDITDSWLIGLYSSQHLRRLNLSGCYKLSDQGIADLIKNTNLQYLGLNWCRRNDTTAKALSESSSIQELEFAHVWVTESFITFLKEMPNLKKLALTGCYSIGDAPSLTILATFPSLEALSLINNRILRDDTLASLAHAEKLKELFIAGCRFSDEAVAALEEARPNLKIDKTRYLSF